MLRDIERERLEITGTIGDMTLVDVLDRNADRFATLPAVRWAAEDGLRTLSWASYRQRVREVAAGLRSLGIEGGDFVAIMAGNRPEHVIADLGAVYAGAVPVSFYNTLAEPQIRYIADHCSARVAVVEDTGYLDRWNEIRADLPGLRHVVVMDLPEEGSGEGVLSWDDLVARGKAALDEEADLVDRSSAAVSQTDLATLIYTSGTTGTPKAVMISHRNVLWTLECISRTFDPPNTCASFPTCRSPTSASAWRATTRVCGMPVRFATCRTSRRWRGPFRRPGRRSSSQCLAFGRSSTPA